MCALGTSPLAAVESSKTGDKELVLITLKQPLACHFQLSQLQLGYLGRTRSPSYQNQKNYAGISVRVRVRFTPVKGNTSRSFLTGRRRVWRCLDNESVKNTQF
ncbi:unnamed protein product [Leuciscus chuanchicus]